MRHGAFVVEGAHDAWFLYRFLKLSPKPFEVVKHLDTLSPEWRGIIPRVFPHDGDLMRRVPVPLFFANEEVTVAIVLAIGESNIPSNVADLLTAESMGKTPKLDFLGVLIDADNQEGTEKYQQFCTAMANVNVHLPPGPGLVSNSGLRMGVWVFPDCRSAGTLEDLLKTAGQEVNPKLMDNAGRFIGELGDLRDLGLNRGERREFKKTCRQGQSPAGGCRPCFAARSRSTQLHSR